MSLHRSTHFSDNLRAVSENRRQLSLVFSLGGISLILLFLLCSGCVSTPGPLPQNQSKSIEITDSEGTPISFPHTVSRIVCLNDDTTEMLITLGAAGSLVGVTSTAKNSTLMKVSLSSVHNVGNWMTPNVETIISLNPDVIIGYSTAKPKNLELLRSVGVPIIFLDCYRLQKLPDDAMALGILTDHEKNASRYVEFFTRYTTLVQNRITQIHATPPKVYFESYTDYSVMTTRSAGGQILEFLHIPNVYGNYSSDWVTVSPEWVILKNPDIILKLASDSQKTHKSLSELVSGISNRTGFANLSAVRNGRIFAMHGDLGSSPRDIFGLLYCAKSIYPEYFTDVSLDEVMTAYSQEF
ncbi:ABC transporter substrate-binding protein, partial [Methanospirillum sp.]|uniref:ABC transporter substrate-binding protein n=1 Tax=Methanospirillum sp. TaxID=45200 RepID=UPI0026296F94